MKKFHKLFVYGTFFMHVYKIDYPIILPLANAGVI